MVLKDGNVMSKSKGNVVDPDTMLQKFGADALRLYVMFVAPPEKEVEWTDAGLEGSFRFLARLWRLVDHWSGAVVSSRGQSEPHELTTAERALRRKTHDTIRRVTVDIEERQQLNTAVSALMELVNELYAFSEQTESGGPGRHVAGSTQTSVLERPETITVVTEAVDALVRMLAPFAPHTGEELWEKLGHTGGLRAARWPEFDATVAQAEQIVVPVQINGKVRCRLTVAASTTESELEAIALGDPAVKSHIQGKTIRKVVVVKGKLVSLVVQ
jgi:leucyl-tRNA synthetase